MRALAIAAAIGAIAADPAAALARPSSPSGCITQLPDGIYDAPQVTGPAPEAYRIAVVDGCISINPGGFREARDTLVGRELQRMWSDGKACHSGWTVRFTGFTTEIKATASSFSTCGGNRSKTFAPVTLRRVAKISGTPESLLDHSDVQVGLAALERVAIRQSDKRFAAALDEAIRRGAGKARPAHSAVALRAVVLATSPRLIDALVVAAPSFPSAVADALGRTVRSPRHAARLIGRIVKGTAEGDGDKVRAPAQALDRLLDSANRKALVTELRIAARGDDPKPALVALSVVSRDATDLARLVLAGAAASKRCKRAMAYLSEARTQDLEKVDVAALTGLFSMLLQPEVCALVRVRAASLLASLIDRGVGAELTALAGRIGKSDTDPQVREQLSKF